MTRRSRMMALAAVLGGLGIAVAIDRVGGAGAEEASAGALSRYEQESRLVGEMQSALKRADAWRAASEAAQGAFAQAASRMLVSESEDIAFARLREIVQAEMADLGLTSDGASALRATTPLEGESMRVVGLRVEFAARDPELVYRLIDRLEHLPQAAASVVGVSIVGPGRLGRSRAAVTLDVRALAWIGRSA